MPNVSMTLLGAPGNQNVQTMSSREIAELVDKRHDNVKRTIETLADSGVISRPQIEEVKIQRERRMETVKVYVFSGEQGKRDSIVVVAQLCPEFTARLVDRWAELERAMQAQLPVIPQTLPEALRLAADLADDLSAERAKTALMAPKVDAFDRIASADGSLCVTDTAKALQQRPKDLTLWLQANNWAYRRAGNMPLLGYQDKVQRGYLTHKVTPYTKADGSEGFNEQMRVTPKGLARLALIFGVTLESGLVA